MIIIPAFIRKREKRIMSLSRLDRISIVLVGTLSSGNVGSVARAMLNMGLSRLVLVNPQCEPLDAEAVRMARDAQNILQSAIEVETLEEALADCHYAAATTARIGKRRGAARRPREIASHLLAQAGSGQVALVFGPEDRGLCAEHVALCQEVITIPTAPAFKSLNLAQAVLILAYELFLASADLKQPAAPRRAALGTQETLFQDLQEVLLEIGYLNPENPEHIMLDLRQLLGRAGLTEREVRILRGLVRQIRWAASTGNQDREAGEQKSDNGN